MIGTAQQLSGLFASDEVLKSGIADYAFEHDEIAAYKMSIAAAGEAGETEVQRRLEENLREEEAMAEWLGQDLPEVTREYRTVKPPDSQPKSEDRGRARAREARSSYGSGTSMTRPVPPQVVQRLRPRRPVPWHAGQICSPAPGAPGGASAPLLVPRPPPRPEPVIFGGLGAALLLPKQIRMPLIRS